MDLELREGVTGFRVDGQWRTAVLAPSGLVLCVHSGETLLGLRDGSEAFRLPCSCPGLALLDLSEKANIHPALEGAAPGTRSRLAFLETLALSRSRVRLWSALLADCRGREAPFGERHPWRGENLQRLAAQLGREGPEGSGDWRYLLRDQGMPSGEDIEALLDFALPARSSDLLAAEARLGFAEAFAPLLRILRENDESAAFRSAHPERRWSWEDDTDRPYEGGEPPPQGGESAAARAFRAFRRLFVEDGPVSPRP